MIIFADIGQDCRTFALAHYRLAPYQIAYWGWGGTLGIPAIDYYIFPQVFWYNTKCMISNKLSTPQELYSEQVIILLLFIFTSFLFHLNIVVIIKIYY